MPNGFAKVSKPAFSRSPYAFDLDSFNPETNMIDCVWVKKVSGAYKVSIGTYHLWIQPAHRDNIDTKNVLEVLNRTEIVYGGKWIANWNDEKFSLNPEYNDMPLEDQIELRDKLSYILDNLPAGPVDYDHWWVARR